MSWYVFWLRKEPSIKYVCSCTYESPGEGWLSLAEVRFLVLKLIFLHFVSCWSRSHDKWLKNLGNEDIFKTVYLSFNWLSYSGGLEFELVTRGFKLAARKFELTTCGFELANREFELVTSGFKLATHDLNS